VNTDGSNLEPDTDVGPVDLWMLWNAYWTPLKHRLTHISAKINIHTPDRQKLYKRIMYKMYM
jgi:hypothetical protein